MKRARSRPWRWLAIAAIAVALVAAARLLPAREWVGAFQAWISGLGPAAPLVFSAVYVAVALLIGPVWLLTLVAGLTWGLGTALPLVSAASTLAAALAFLIARHFARAKVEAFARRNATFAAIDRAIERKGWRIVFLLRLSPVVPYGPSNYLYGVTAIRFWPYVLASWVGMIPVTLLYLTIGAAGKAALGGRTGRSPGEWAALGAGLVATAVVTVWVTRAAKAELAKSRVAPQAAAS
ncbi:MAG: TVP38/TMEM64 family protein [Thermoanaerobaculia bacterium]|nr:VTT domain-containing protein [Acidobacteriota bacterium]